MDKILEHSSGGARHQDQGVIIITGSSGLIGSSLIKRLAPYYRIVGLDRLGPPYPPLQAECVNFNIVDEKSIDNALERVRYGYGSNIASVIHLAAYYNFNTKESRKYETINIEGTKNLLSQLHDFNVKQFIFSSTNLLYKPTRPGVLINEDSPMEGSWGYPKSKIETEKIISEYNKNINTVYLRIAGVYNDYGHSIPITQQIKRIYEKEMVSRFYSGNLNHGNSFIHLQDLLDAIVNTVESRGKLPKEIALNIGEPVSPTYEELQDEIGKLLYEKPWKTYKIPKSLAKIGASIRNVFGDPFIKPWMIDRADDHFELDIKRAKKILDWQPKHKIMKTLPLIIKNLKENPEEWYSKNKIN